MKVCDNVYLTKAAISLQVPCFPSQFGDFPSECSDPNYSKHTTLQFFTLQSYVFASIFVFQGLIYALLGQQRREKKKGSSEGEVISLHYTPGTVHKKHKAHP